MEIKLGTLPYCPKCGKGLLLPFEDAWEKGDVAFLKMWACSNCPHNIVFTGGQLGTLPLVVKER